MSNLELRHVVHHYCEPVSSHLYLGGTVLELSVQVTHYGKLAPGKYLTLYSVVSILDHPEIR